MFRGRLCKITSVEEPAVLITSALDFIVTNASDMILLAGEGGAFSDLVGTIAGGSFSGRFTADIITGEAGVSTMRGAVSGSAKGDVR